MSDKLSFQDLQSTCQALGAFADARLQEQSDKDIILTIKKINGREILQTTRLSTMTWCARLIRWFGFGGSTLTSVARFLENHEPYLPSFASLKDKNILCDHYTEGAICKLGQIEKAPWTNLKKQKTQGCEVFKRCLTHYNRQHSGKIHILLQEYEKIDLGSHGSMHCGGIFHSWPNPMGVFHEDEHTLRERYKPPIIDTNEFMYLDPFFRTTNHNLPPETLGFCYEYGLGTQKNIDKAIKNYREACADHKYSACYNLGCLLLKKNNIQEAIDSLRKAERILLRRIGDTEKAIADLRTKPRHIQIQELFNDPSGEQLNQPEREETIEEHEKRMKQVEELEQTNGPYIKKWNKALQKTHLVLIEAYTRTGDALLKAEYEQKLQVSGSVKTP